MTMDQARALLREARDALRSPAPIDRAALADQIDLAERRLYRRSAVRKAPVQSSPVTPDIADRIRVMAQRNHRLTQAQIAAELGINQGRVSEVLAGERA